MNNRSIPSNFTDTAEGMAYLLQTLVPVNALTEDHLKTLMRDRSIDIVCAGQALFSLGDYDNQHVFLLSGRVKLTDEQGESIELSADDPRCRFSLKQHQPRRHSAEAVTDCSVIRFDSDKLDAMLAWDQASSYIMLDIASQRELDEDADWMLTLLKSNLFYKVPPMNIREIINRFRAEVHKPGTTIIRQGEVGHECYFIKEGKVGVYQAKDDKASPELVAELGVGRCFGEDALVYETVRNATIKVHENSVLMHLEKNDFFLLLKPPQVDELHLSEALQRIEEGAQWLDVRTQDEYENGHYEGAKHMPLNLLKLKSRLLDKSTAYVFYCNSGRRSAAAAHFLREEGYQVSMLQGGYQAYPLTQQLTFGVSL